MALIGLLLVIKPELIPLSILLLPGAEAVVPLGLHQVTPLGAEEVLVVTEHRLQGKTPAEGVVPRRF